MGIKYLDFDLLIERAADSYRARVLDSPAGEASIEFKVPFSQSELNDFFLQIGQTRSFETDQTRRIREFGQSLFEAVFSGPIRDRLRASIGEASSKNEGLRIRLRLTGAPELGNLPWEFLYDSGANRFLALSVETPLVRYLETPQMAQPFAVQPPLRILTMICGPQDFPRLDSEREWEHLQDAMRGLEERGLVSLVRLEPPTLQSLQRQLRRDQYHIFHFVGHGIFSRSDQDGYLLFEDAQRGGHRVSGHDLGTILHDHRPLRLVMLNACEGARAALDDQFAGTAQSLIQQGIPAVIAMQFRITDQASILLAREFYGALADGYPVDASLTEARKAIKTEGNDLEWGTPVLYMRSPDGRIFDITQLPAPAWPTSRAQPRDPEKAAKLNRLYTEGLEAFYLGQWETAFRKFQAIVDADPGHKDAADKLEIARKRMQVQALNEQAQNAEKTGDWDQTVQALDKLAAADPGFPEIAERTTRARRQAQLADLYAEARQLAQAEKWQAIPGIFREIDQLSPRYPDPDDLRNKAQHQVAKSKREAELDSAYTAALRAFEGSDWNTAVRHLRHVRRLDPGYRETDQLLRRAEVEIEHKRIASRRSEVTARNAPEGNHETLLLQLFLFAALANLAARLLVERLILPAVQNPYLTQLANLIPQSAIAGMIVLWLLRKSVGRLDWRKTLAVMAFIIVFQTAAVELGIWIDPGNQGWVWRAVGFIMGISMALPAAIFILKMKEQTRWPTLVLIVIGWGISFILGQILAIRITGNFGTLPTFGVYVGMEQAITAFLGGWITIAALEGNGLWPINWKIVLIGALGWGFGNLIVNAAFLKAEAQWLLIPQAALWGFIGASALAYPSRNIKKYILLGILGATGMSLAQVLTQVFPGLHGPWLLGGLAGLFIGLATKKASKMMALAITGLIALTMRMAMVFLYNENIDPAKTASLPVLAITAAIAGAILAIGWCYFRGEKAALPAAKGTPQ